MKNNTNTASQATTPAKYVQDAGWSFDEIEATARDGVAQTDSDRCAELGLDPEALLSYCRSRGTAYGVIWSDWLATAGGQKAIDAHGYDSLRRAWRAGEDPADYRE